MARILVTEALSDRGLEAMAAAGHEVDVRLGLSHDDLVEAIGGAAALVVRSATKVNEEVLAAGSDLVVVGRAGVGLDNVDVAAATKLGVLVVNAPESNILSAAELAMALLLAQARNIPQAHSALVAGSLGAVTLGRGRAARQDARRRRPRPDRGARRPAGERLRDAARSPTTPTSRPSGPSGWGSSSFALDELVAGSDFITIHLPKNKETVGLFGKELLARTKPGVRIVNAARGGIVDEEALAEAIRSGHVGGAALDVFNEEPTTQLAAVRAGERRRHPAPRGEHRRGTGQGGRADRRAGPAGVGGRLRAIRGEHRGRSRPPIEYGRSSASPRSSGASSPPSRGASRAS